MKNFADMMKQAQNLQKQMQDAQESLAALEAEGVAGGGLVRVQMNGKGYARKVEIDPKMFSEEDKEVLEDLITAAVNDAKAKLEEQSAEKMKEMTAGLPLPPGMKLPF
ncbi:YbaB/EbfC family nucleoid-associated protein [Parvularcula sp. ZS-1/3]|uniref:Nucleoid-associated protein HK107_05710 n=1 Tax=Parvularcula mediterranea TaxID=2732508 RepID=A0A7Y3W4J3_9PROT|nr:YbaB/EbfC family nucleoid-associated protein [Parvularcula mediterranea]NNU15815.1 YbaB/EbfC family nucleoid-associated protein [Parvularcula mediterranea]